MLIMSQGWSLDIFRGLQIYVNDTGEFELDQVIKKKALWEQVYVFLAVMNDTHRRWQVLIGSMCSFSP